MTEYWRVLDKKVMNTAEGDGGAPAGGGENPPDGGLEGDDSLEGGSLVGGGEGNEGTPPTNDGNQPPANNGDGGTEGNQPPELNDEQWLEAIKFTEEIGKDADGKELLVNKEAVKQFMPALRKIGLTPEQASELATHYAKLERDNLAKMQEAIKKENDECLSKLRAQRDELAKLSKETLTEEDLAYANRAVNQFKTSDPKFYKVIQTSLLGVHPSFLKICANAGRNQADDSLPKTASVGSGAQKSPAEILYARQIAAGIMNP
jgi:hypothetical protein